MATTSFIFQEVPDQVVPLACFHVLDEHFREFLVHRGRVRLRVGAFLYQVYLLDPATLVDMQECNLVPKKTSSLGKGSQVLVLDIGWLLKLFPGLPGRPGTTRLVHQCSVKLRLDRRVFDVLLRENPLPGQYQLAIRLAFQDFERGDDVFIQDYLERDIIEHDFITRRSGARSLVVHECFQVVEFQGVSLYPFPRGLKNLSWPHPERCCIEKVKKSMESRYHEGGARLPRAACQ